MQNLGDSGTASDGLSPEAEAELFLTNYVNEGLYTDTDAPTFITAIQSGQPSAFLTNLGSSLQYANYSTSDLQAIRQNWFDASNNLALRASIDIGLASPNFPDVTQIMALIAAYPSSFKVVATQAAVATANQVATVAALGLGSYTLFLVGGAVIAGYLVLKNAFGGNSAPARANPRRSKRYRA